MSACALHRWKINLTVVHDFVGHDFVFVLKHSKPKYVYDLLRTRVIWDISKEMTKWLFDKVGSLSGLVIFRLIYYDHVDKQIKVQILFLFTAFCVVFSCFPVCLRPVSCVPNVASFSGLSILDYPHWFSLTLIFWDPFSDLKGIVFVFITWGNRES